jgi:small subunit ribosomal protein S17
MPKRVVTGVVTRDKAPKTRRVEVARLVRHPMYGKILHRRTVCYAHDEENVSKMGDTVEIEESPPRSKLKRWVLKRIVAKAKQTGPDVADIEVGVETTNDQ